MLISKHLQVSLASEHRTHFHKVGMLGVADSNNCVHFFNQFLLLVVVKVHVPLGQPRLAGTVLNQDEPNLQQPTMHQISRFTNKIMH